jgi:two-component sensor histidine kinase
MTKLCGVDMVRRSPIVGFGDEPLLYVNEFLHRVRNEYASVISLASLKAAKCSNQEVRAALDEVAGYLHALAEKHRVLRPPLAAVPEDLTANLKQLCRAMIPAGLAQRGITLRFHAAERIVLEAARCWRAGLIVSEFITNAARHAFRSRAGNISVAVRPVLERVVCRVSDDGSSTVRFMPGAGTRLVDALAADLDGYVKRQFSKSGTTVTLSFPKHSPLLATGKETLHPSEQGLMSLCLDTKKPRSLCFDAKEASK